MCIRDRIWSTPNGGETTDQAEALILPGLEDKITKFKAEKNKNPNLYLYSFAAPCCKKKGDGEDQCGGDSCSQLINDYIHEHLADLDKIYIAWDRFLGRGMQPFTKAYMLILNTLLQANTGRDKVGIVTRPQGFASKDVKKSIYIQNHVVDCLKREASPDFFIDPRKFEENLIKIINSIVCTVEAEDITTKSVGQAFVQSQGVRK